MYILAPSILAADFSRLGVCSDGGNTAEYVLYSIT